MSAEEVSSLSQDFVRLTNPVAFVLLVILAGLAVYALLKGVGFIFILGVKTAARNPWRRAHPERVTGQSTYSRVRPLARVIAGSILVVAGLTLSLGRTRGHSAAGGAPPPPFASSVVEADPVKVKGALPDVAFAIDAAGTHALSALPLTPDSGGLPRPPSVDLLGLIDPAVDKVAGVWQFKESKLITTGKPFDRIVIPYIPPEEYDVVVVAERQAGSNSLNLGLAVGEVQFVVILDAAINGEIVSGLDLVNGKPLYANETTVKGEQFVKGQPNRVHCSVRKSHITVAVNGKTIIQWKADYRRLSLFTGWKVPRRDTLFIGTWTGVVRYHSLTLQAVSGQGKRLREAPTKADKAASERVPK